MADEATTASEVAKGGSSHLGPYLLGCLYGIAALSLIGAFWLLLRAALSRRILIEPFVIPKAVEELGWTGTVLAHQLGDAIAAIGRRCRSSRETEEFQRPGDVRNYATIAVGGVGFTFQGLVQAIRDLFKIGTGRVSAELIMRAQANGTPSRGIELIGR